MVKSPFNSNVLIIIFVPTAHFSRFILTLLHCNNFFEFTIFQIKCIFVEIILKEKILNRLENGKS